MKICVLTENYGKGYTGAMTSTYELINRWVKSNIKVEVLTLNIVGSTNENIKLKRFNNIIKLFNFIRRNNFEGFVGYSDDHFGFLFKLLRIPYVHTYHGNWPSALLHNGVFNFLKGLILIPLYILTIHYANYVGSVSKHALKFISKYNNNFGIIHNGVDIEKLYLQDQINLRNNIKIVMVGNVDKRKFLMLVKILKDIPLKVLKKLHIYIFGKIDNKNIYRSLKVFHIHFLGFRSDIPYSNFDIYLSTSLMENLSIAAVEAISSGVPVITFNIGGMNEIIKQDRTGIIVPSYGTHLMAKLLINIVNNGTTFKFDNDYIINDFNWNKTSDRYIKLFRGIRFKL